MTKAILESGHLKETDGHYVLTGSFSTFAIPATLQDSLMARLDRLVTAKGMAQYAAVIGRQFTYPLLQTVSQLDDSHLAAGVRTGWSKRRLSTNEGYHHRQRIPLSMRSFRMPRMRPC